MQSGKFSDLREIENSTKFDLRLKASGHSNISQLDNQSFAGLILQN